MTDINVLKAELDVDPLARGYAGFTDQQAASDLMTIYRDEPTNFQSILTYLISNKNRTNTGSNPGDTISTFCYGRIEMVAAADIGSNPFDATPAFAVTKTMQHSCRTVLAILIQNFGGIAFNWNGSIGQELLADLVTAGAIGAADKTAIQALSAGQQSRANELGLGRVSPNEVSRARAL